MTFKQNSETGPSEQRQVGYRTEQINEIFYSTNYQRQKKKDDQ